MKRSSRLLAVGLFGSLLFSTAAHATVLWRGDFETGDRSQWTGSQLVSADRLQIVEDPVREGRYALRTRVVKGDDPIDASGNRNEVLYTKGMPASGDERFYAWSTLWPSDYASADTWQLFTQFHHTGLTGSPPLELFVRGEQMFLRVDGEDVWTAPLERARWRDFVLHVKWSSNASVGFVELYLDGKLVLPKTYGATLYSGQSVYLKLGLYRNESVSATQTLFHDGMTIATSLDDVMTTSGELVAEPKPSDSNNTPPTSGSGSDSLGSTDTQAAKASGCSTSGAGTAGALCALMLFAGMQRLRRAAAQKRA